ncbi:MAG TPA: 16S rRNA (adenine(1518)-N(6)/adenine(1519)-N(6))-dimethyltransferase RsmA [archaeon]|nr:16S rRNA (adenine(1518)-N(6)/adenine(1519)-N(6))-dimethyltransferase RsmA [archaeon]
MVRMKNSQVFLKSKKVVEDMVSAAELSMEDVVLEIGPGRGIITEKIAKNAGKVYAIEADRKLASELSMDNVQIITGDALKVEWPEFNKMIANIPFHISSPLTFKLFESSWESAILIYQKEFADRFFQKAGNRDYSRLTVAINYHAKPTYLKTLPPSLFSPKPKVSCALVKLERKKPEFETDEFFWRIISSLFQHKKKTLRAALKDSRIKIELPERFDKKRVFQCDIYDFKTIVDIAREKHEKQ